MITWSFSLKCYYLSLVKESIQIKIISNCNALLLKHTFDNEKITNRYLQAMKESLKELDVEKRIIKYIIEDKKYIYPLDANLVIEFLENRSKERDDYLNELYENFNEAKNCMLESKCYLPRNHYQTYTDEDIKHCHNLLEGKDILNVYSFFEYYQLFSSEYLKNIYINAKKVDSNDDIWFGIFKYSDSNLPAMILPKIKNEKDILITIYYFVRLYCLISNESLKYSIEEYLKENTENNIEYKDLEKCLFTEEEIEDLASYYELYYKELYEFDIDIVATSNAKELLEENPSGNIKETIKKLQLLNKEK